MKRILKCPKCDSYTMEEECSECKVKTLAIIPAKYSPDDRMGKYRRMGKKEEKKD